MQTPISLDTVVPEDRPLFHAVNVFARDTGWLHSPMVDYASYGVAMFACLLLVGWWVARSSGDQATVAAALWAPMGALVALAVNQPLANAFREPRPYVVLPHMLLLTHRSADYSFPSDHAVMAGAVAAGLFLVSRRLGVVAAVAALLMALARVYVGAHWPGDVAAGLVVGGVVTAGGFLLVRRPAVMVVGRLVRTPLRPLLVAAVGTDDHGRELPTVSTQ
jgi:membrane-associated phospholipid phosphatase